MANPPDHPTRSDVSEDYELAALSTGSGQVRLEYPQLPLHLSLDSLLAYSPSSASLSIGSMPPSELNHPALEDSWASLAGSESSNEDDLQSENTDVGSLLDVHSTDDIQSVSDELHVVEAESTDEEDVGDTFTEDLGQHRPLRVAIPQDTDVDRPLTSTSLSPFQEEEAVDCSTTSARTHVARRPLNESETQELLPYVRDDVEFSNYSSILQMSVLNDGLDLDALGYFKIVLLGRHVEQFRTEIQRKLGDALVASRATSLASSSTSIARFHLVPNAFGPGSEPDFADLVAIDKQIDFDCYNLVKVSSSPDRQGSLILKNSQTRSEVVSEWNGHRFVVTNPRWTLPDLAVICVHLDRENKMDSDSHRMLSFAERHGIPKILIRMERGWVGTYHGAWDAESLHERVESQPQQLQGPWTSSKSPLNMATFLNLDSTLLNKHIAYVTADAQQDCQGKVTEFAPILNETREKQPGHWFKYPPLNASFFTNVFIVLWITGVYIFLGVHLWPLVADPSAGATPETVMMSSAGEESSCLSASFSVSEYTIGKESATVQQVIETPSVSALPAMGEDTAHFQVGIAGENQLVVKLPKIALSRKKRSPLSVVLKRKEQILTVVAHELFDGVYSIQLLPRDTYGDIDVNLTMTQPPISESLTVTFGDRTMFDWQPLKKILTEVNGRLQRAHSAFLNYSQYAQHVVPRPDLADKLPNFVKWLREGFEPLHSGRWMTEWPGPVLEKIQSLYSIITRPTDESALRRHSVADHIVDGISTARKALFSLAEIVNKSIVRPGLDTTVVTETMGTAQGRAQRLVAKAAGRLRS